MFIIITFILINNINIITNHRQNWILNESIFIHIKWQDTCSQHQRSMMHNHREAFWWSFFLVSLNISKVLCDPPPPPQLKNTPNGLLLGFYWDLGSLIWRHPQARSHPQSRRTLVLHRIVCFLFDTRTIYVFVTLPNTNPANVHPNPTSWHLYIHH